MPLELDPEVTRARAIAEAVERSAWSRWIDLKRPVLRRISRPKSLSPIAARIRDGFDETQYFEGLFSVGATKLRMGVVLGVLGGGVFPGSRVCSMVSGAQPWEHALIEAWRHRIAFEKVLSAGEASASFPLNRVIYFGRNGIEALRQLPLEEDDPGPADDFRFDVDFVKRVDKLPELARIGACVFRALDTTSIPWTEGDHTRFVY